jgi:integrase
LFAVSRLCFSCFFHGFLGSLGMPDLSRIGERERLKPNAGDEPHWQRLQPGCYLGFRPSKKKVGGTWFARVSDPNKQGRYVRKALGAYSLLSGHEVFKQAKADAENWAKMVESGGQLEEGMVTVKDACDAYLQEKPGTIAEGVFRRHVYSDPIAQIRLDKLRRHHLRAWRKRLEDAPALLTRNKKGKRETKIRSDATINRDMVPLRAALRRILTLGPPNTDAAWQEALKPIPNAGRRRELYLDKDQRRRLLEAASDQAKAFIKGLCVLPLRPGALASLKVRHFDARTRTLTVGKDKHGNPRQITVPSVMTNFLTKLTEGQPSTAPLFAQPDGSAWHKDAWKGPIKEAVVAAKLPSSATAYTLRHSVITDLVRARLPILTVAQLSGTSVKMIEDHYGHLVRDDAESALASIAF